MSLPRAAGLLCVVGLLHTFAQLPAWAQTAPRDLSGRWSIKHSFDIAAAIPPELKKGFEPLRNVDQAILRELHLGKRQASLEPIIAAEIRKYLSPALPSMLRIGDGLPIVLSTLRSEGAMRLAKGADFINVKGTEVWTSLIFYWLPLCGDNIGGDPRLPPECARFDIATSDNDNPEEAPQCKGQVVPTIPIVPFTATVADEGQGRPQLTVDPRRVIVQTGKMTLSVVDELLARTTPYSCIEEATDCESGACVVDCGALAESVADLGPDVAEKTKAACVKGVKKAGREAKQTLLHAWADIALLDFTGSATISNDGSTLGRPDYDTLLIKDPEHRDGSWTGSFFSKTLAKMPGAWHATRQPRQ